MAKVIEIGEYTKQKEFIDSKRYFGLQRFTDPSEALIVMEGSWGIEDEEGQPKLLIAISDDIFKKAILRRAVEKYLDYKMGEISLEDCNTALGIGEDISDYLLDFDFLLYSDISKCYYTSRMFFKDDYVTEWNDTQWEYYSELYELYSFDGIAEKAKEIIDLYFEKYVTQIEKEDKDFILTEIMNEYGLFY